MSSHRHRQPVLRQLRVAPFFGSEGAFYAFQYFSCFTLFRWV
jgi:hypothetical protein